LDPLAQQLVNLDKCNIFLGFLIFISYYIEKIRNMKKIALLVAIFIVNIGTSQYINSSSNLISEYSTYNNNSGILITDNYLHPVDKANELTELYPNKNYTIQYWIKKNSPYTLEENIKNILLNFNNTNELYLFLLNSNYELGAYTPGNSKEKSNVIDNWYYHISDDNTTITLIVPSINDDQWISNLFPGF